MGGSMTTLESSAAITALPDIRPIGFDRPVAAALPAALECLVTRVRPRKILLFGSYAYGTPTPDSDVDLLVVLESPLPFIERQTLVSEALCPRPFPVDLLVVTPTELSERLASGNYFFVEITRRGRVLYEQPE